MPLPRRVQQSMIEDGLGKGHRRVDRLGDGSGSSFTEIFVQRSIVLLSTTLPSAEPVGRHTFRDRFSFSTNCSYHIRG
jgi:hypothetical protein